MAIKTTCIGAYPKPDFVTLPDWFANADTPDPTGGWKEALDAMGPDAQAVIDRGIRQAVADQVACGIDIPTDGEIPRENYIHYHCRHLDGFDFDKLTEKSVRNGNYVANLPTIRAEVRAKRSFLPRDWRVASDATDRPVKITLPGPMTMGDTTADAFYRDGRRRGEALADAINAEVLALAEAGCRYIQIDEPVFARQPQRALEYGVEHLDRAFKDCPDSVTRVMHMCCGYPDRIDRDDYPKADPQAYFDLAAAVDASSVHQVSLEDAHRHNDLGLLEHFSRSTVIFGAVAIAQSRIETAEEIAQRLRLALEHIDADRLVAAPDCGLGFLGRDLARAKLTNLCDAAHGL